MKQILDKLNELILVCETRVKKVESEKVTIISKKYNLDEKEKALDARVVDLDNREAIIKKSEAVKMTLDEANEIKSNISDGEKIIKRDQAKFEEEKKAFAKKCEEDTAEFNRKKIKLEKQFLELGEMKKKYKEEVLANVDKMLKEKGVKF